MATGPPHRRRDEFEAVALPHMDGMFRLALHLTRNRKDAEDLVQEAYLRAFRFFDSFERGTQIKAWLYRILRNTFINRYRAKKVRPDEVDFEKIEAVYETVAREEFSAGSRSPDPERFVMEGVLDEEIREAMADLPEEYRSVVVLALVDDLSYREIATVLSVPIGTVMSRLHRGRKRLQARLVDLARKRGIIKGHESVG